MRRYLVGRTDRHGIEVVAGGGLCAVVLVPRCCPQVYERGWLYTDFAAAWRAAERWDRDGEDEPAGWWERLPAGRLVLPPWRR